MNEETAMTLAQIAQVLSEMVEISQQEEDPSGDDNNEASQVLNITPDGVSFAGYSIEEIKQIEETVIRILGKFPANGERKAGFGVV